MFVISSVDSHRPRSLAAVVVIVFDDSSVLRLSNGLMLLKREKN